MFRKTAIVIFFVALAFQYSNAQSPADSDMLNSENPSLSTQDQLSPALESTPPVTMEAPRNPVEEAVVKDGFVSLDFREADIRNVLRILAYKSGVNIVAGPEVSGLVTIQLTDVPWEQALQVVLETQGYA